MADRLNKELKSRKEKDFKEAEAIKKFVEDSNQLLLGSYEQDEEIKRDLNIHSNVNYEERITENTKRLTIYQKLYDQETYTGEQIKHLCNKYDLRVLPISKYTGKIPPELYRKIAEFKKKNEKNKVRITEQNFHILAPVEMFETVKVRKILDKDPIIFYREEPNTDYITENEVVTNVYGWGNDFSILRIFRYFWNPYKEYSNKGMSNRSRTLLFLALFGIIAYMHVLNLPFIIAFIGNLLLGISYIYGTLMNKDYDEFWNTNQK